MTRYAAIAAAAGLAVGCAGGPMTFLGYRVGSDALYDTNIRTVYVPTFANRAFQTTPFRGLELDLQRAVVREINLKTPYRVTSDPDAADTELQANVVGIGETILNRNQQNLTREAEIVLTVDVLWRDLRSGEILSAPKRRGPGQPGVPAVPTDPPPVFDPSNPPPLPPAVVQNAPPTRLVATGRLLPELGESSTIASQRAVNSMAVQIVSMMEKPW